MIKLLSNIRLAIFSLILLASIQTYGQAANADDVRELMCNESIFSKIRCKTQGYNFFSYFEKRKECIKRKDNAQTVAQGKRIYKNCMK